ncbi:MAG: glycosyltransferase WbuB [Cyanobacteria bacterium QS_8_64_29]|nr:MAG: glycosyltransferase WbuB [Cyanobacteria bacterium QS_8_64_29]
MDELAAGLHRQGLQVRVLASQPAYEALQDRAPAREHAGHATIECLPVLTASRRIRNRALNGLFFCLRCVLRLLHPRDRGDVLLLTTEPPFLPPLGLLTRLLFGQPYVCLIYDVYPDVALALGVVSWRNPVPRIWRWLNRQVWRRASTILVLSSSMKARILAQCPEVAERIEVIHHWADPARIAPLPKADNWFAREHGLVEPFTVLYSGNLGSCHDIETILQAAYEMQGEPVQFVFIGHGTKYAGCRERTRQWQLDNCYFLPYQARETLPYSLTACDLALVSLAAGLEGSVAPSKLYSFLAAGRPVAAVCEPHSYLRSLLQDAQCGAAFDNGDSTGLADYIRALAADPARAERLGRASRRYAQAHFTLEAAAWQYARILAQAATAKAGRAARLP